jgi:hypothetical protein
MEKIARARACVVYRSCVTPAEKAAEAYQALTVRPFLTPDEVAAALGLKSVNTVLRAIDRGDLRAAAFTTRRRRDGRRAGPYRILWADVDAWLYGDACADARPSRTAAAPVPAPETRPAKSPRSPRRGRMQLVRA